MVAELAIFGLFAILALAVIYTLGQTAAGKTLSLEDARRYAAQQVRAARWKCAAEALYHNLPNAKEEYEKLREEEKG